MSMNATILYRGPLSSCNYDCPYCPFAKHRESPEELSRDRAALERFCRWVTERREDRLSIFFTPWGEALVRRWYREAIVELSRMTQVNKVAVQTNLACKLDWLAAADVRKVGLWCTYHPGQTTRDRFLARCRRLAELGVSYSVGCVGLKEHVTEIQQLREALPAEVYLWVNAYKRADDYYDADTQELLERLDPLFPINNQRHASRGRSCRCGSTVFSVDGDGDMRRCHFVKRVIGNIYQPGFEQALAPRPCPNDTCGCHIGYVHLEHLQLYPIYGDGLLERVPIDPQATAVACPERSQQIIPGQRPFWTTHLNDYE